MFILGTSSFGKSKRNLEPSQASMMKVFCEKMLKSARFIVRNQFTRNVVPGPPEIKELIELQEGLLSVDNYFLYCLANLAILFVVFEILLSILNRYKFASSL